MVALAFYAYVNSKLYDQYSANSIPAPPTNISKFEQWTIGPIFYSAVVVAEALGTTSTAQVFDLALNSNNPYTPGYAIYENGALARLALTNFLTDATGASTYTVAVSFAGGSVPQSVSVK